MGSRSERVGKETNQADKAGLAKFVGWKWARQNGEAGVMVVRRARSAQISWSYALEGSGACTTRTRAASSSPVPSMPRLHV
jgi:hypothetical protein